MYSMISDPVIQPKDDEDIATMTIDEIIPRMCHKSHGDVLQCVDCDPRCPYGERAVQIVDAETKDEVKLLTKKQIHDHTTRLNAMKTYIAAERSGDPVTYLKKVCNSDNELRIKQTIYRWRRTYGSDMIQLSIEIQALEKQIAASKEQMNKESSVHVKGPNRVQNQGVFIDAEARATRKQEERISRGFLEQTRRDFEEDILKAEAEIEQHKKAIQDCERRIDNATNRIQAIRQVLEYFKEKDKRYA